ncbi:hypothetical protein MY838_09920 [Haemophilus influenzae]|uniref:Uncharacterized protein n=1 Tax=Haemophilus influenzae TaxID=727 RepID=A0A2S9S0V5_HAEIF|nr:hypothetical protein [Haemophilus influenzae]AXP38828.1 hypothetical protein CH628_00385 [Haemophilus influenzae]KAI98182.1 hypothetical protein CK45_02705 [Haemophilus influenzae]KAI98982.1 hypothetical protein CN10_04850 [Haemophilus influenzae]KAJ00663.1 hypothetical protein CN11_03230 [Haemophilus influenzae]MBZ5690598.1 hypothetical protein [Haemophilus influenzae]
MSARERKRLAQLAEKQEINAKLDEILTLSRQANHKIDRLDGRVDDIDTRLAKVEESLAKLGVRAAVIGGLSGLVVSVGFELIKAKFGG